MTFADLLNAIGQKPGVILAALSGGIARIAIPGIRKSDPNVSRVVYATNTILSIIGGTLTAVFLGPIGPSYFGWEASAPGTLACTFLCGLFALEVLQRIGDTLSRWSPSVTGKGNPP
jgi:hypothetical protein